MAGAAHSSAGDCLADVSPCSVFSHRHARHPGHWWVLYQSCNERFVCTFDLSIYSTKLSTITFLGSVAAPDPELEFRRDLQRRNNLASSRYRAGVRARRAARDQELAQLEAYNWELVTRLAHMTELRDKMKETCLEMVTRGRQR